MNQRWEHRFAHFLKWFAACALAVAGLYPGNNPDTFGHLAQGRQIAQLGEVPQFDNWSLLPGPARPWHNYEWLSDLLFYGLYTGVGYDGLLVFKCALLGLTGYALLAFARRLGGDRALLISALVLLSAIPVTRMRFSDRPHVLGLCLAAFYFVMLSRLVESAPEDRRLSRILMAGLFVLHVLWVNLHGSHLLGIGITVAFLVSSPPASRRALLAVVAFEVLASCISPYGPYIVLDAVEHVLDPRYRGLVTEWMPWTEEDPPWLQLGPALQGALLTVVAPRLWRSRPTARAGLLVALLLGVASFRSIRFVAEFMLLTAPLVGAGYALVFEHWSSQTSLIRTSVTFALLCLLVPWGASGLPPMTGVGHGISYAERPHGPGVLLNRLGEEARVFGSIETNWYLMWEAPRARYVVDGRVPFYGPDFVAHIAQAFHEPRAMDALLHEFDLNTAVLKHTIARDHKVIPHMMGRPGWSLALVDDAFAFFVRDDARNGHQLPRFTALKPDFGSDWILTASQEERDRIARELAALEEFPTADGYRRWGLALLELAPFRLPGRAVGFRWPATQEERTRYDHAARYLAEIQQSVRDVPVVASTQALVAAIRCDFTAAQDAIDHAAMFGAPGRETVLARQEIALRQGHLDQVAAFLDSARALPQGRDDPWLLQMQSGLKSPPSCDGFRL